MEIGLDRLVALCVIVTDPVFVPVEVGEKRTVIVRACPGLMEKEPPPPRIEKSVPVMLTVPTRGLAEEAKFLMTNVSSRLCPMGTVPKSKVVRSTNIRMGSLPTPVRGTVTGVGRLVALCRMDTDPALVPTLVGENRTVTVRDCPGSNEKDPPPLTIENSWPVTLMVPVRGLVEFTELETRKVSSLVWSSPAVPKSTEDGFRLIRTS
jgi:hypothetical protein